MIDLSERPADISMVMARKDPRWMICKECGKEYYLPNYDPGTYSEDDMNRCNECYAKHTNDDNGKQIRYMPYLQCNHCKLDHCCWSLGSFIRKDNPPNECRYYMDKKEAVIG